MTRPSLLAHCLVLLTLGACGEGGDLIIDGYDCGEGTHPEGDECVPDTGYAPCDCDSGAESCEDLDEDGWPRSAGDCDDADPAVNPGADEVCNGVDDDCDGYIDNYADDGADWYPDGDGDGYGDPAGKSINACSAPSGHVADNTDCDDADANRNPGMEEIWYDGVDSDCLGDDDYDQDGDGYQSSDYKGEDCDDTSAEAGPHMSEICDDGLDNDCDGTNNGCGIEGTASLADGDAVLQGAAAGDYAGVAVAGAGDVNGDGYDDVLVGSPRADTAGSNAGDAYLLLGPISGTASLSTADAVISGLAAGDLAGTALVGLGDWNGDGFGEIVIGAYGDDSASSGAGAAYILEGPVATGSVTDAVATVLGSADNDGLGYAVARIRDVNADTIPDLLVGAYGSDSTGSNAGSAYLFTGPITGQVTTSSAAASFHGDRDGDSAGWAVGGAGDTNGDAISDLIVGAPSSDNTATDAGVAAIFLGTPAGSVSLSSADAVLTGVAASDAAGYAVAGAGDVNGDGYDDVVVGAYGADDAATSGGVAYIIQGPMVGTKSLADAEIIVRGDSASGRLGIAVAAAGDINSDGMGDVLLGADRYYGGLGAAYLVLGGSFGSFDASASDAMLEGETYSDWAGASVAGAGDTNADGRDDVLVGAWGNDAAGTDAGAAYLFEGHGI
jgi:hypothetical protein